MRPRLHRSPSSSLLFVAAGAVVAASAVVACATDEPEGSAEGASAISSAVRVTLQTTVNPFFVAAENGGGGVLNANRASAAGWETFTLVDVNGGALASGDAVQLKAASGAYVQAVGGGGGALNAAGANAGAWETFRLVRQKGAGTVAAGDVVGFQAANGRWISAPNGGGPGGAVSASGAAASTWEQFRLQFPDGAPSAGTTTAGTASAGSTSAGTTTAGTTPTPPPAGGSGSSCAASLAGNTPLGKDRAPASGEVVDAITITNVGGTGSYDKVVSMAPGTWPTCTDTAAACVKAKKTVSGPLVPFDEEQSMVFSGPMDLYEIGVYYPSGSGFTRVSHWDRCGSDNLTFMNNAGGGDVSGTWSICSGSSQSYASANGEAAARAPTAFSGHLADGKGVNVMQASACQGQGDGSECGFYRDVGLHGWKGAQDGTKIFAVKLRMPLGNVTPAYWILPAQVLRTAQYGCNCRGMGGAGGCGELDVAEVLPGQDPLRATSTIYSFKSVTGGGSASFQRPVLETATFVVIFDGTGTISLRRLPATGFDFGATLPAATVDAWRANKGAVRPM